MKRPVKLLFVAALCAGMTATACGDTSPTAPAVADISARQSEEQQLLGGLIGTVIGLLGFVGDFLVPPVQRTTPLAEDVSWSFTVGSGGGSSSNSAVGLSIVVPSGALSSTQTITVTALKGSMVAYKFEPHGLQFSRPVVLTQSLNGTNVGLLYLKPLSAAYFETDRPEVNGSGLVAVTELLGTILNPLTRKVSFGIKHFSGYIVASGRASDLAGE
jgi:hypothetical protein